MGRPGRCNPEFRMKWRVLLGRKAHPCENVPQRIARNIEGRVATEPWDILGRSGEEAVASAICIARNVIPRVRPPLCCVQYTWSNPDIACSVNCTQSTGDSYR